MQTYLLHENIITIPRESPKLKIEKAASWSFLKIVPRNAAKIRYEIRNALASDKI